MSSSTFKVGKTNTLELEGAKYSINPDQSLRIRSVTQIETNFTEKLSTIAEPTKHKVSIVDFPHACSSQALIPKDYIKSSSAESETEFDHVEYDVDREDLAWLEIANKRRENLRIDPINEDVFERAMNLIEKESHFQSLSSDSQTHSHFPAIDNDAPCCICNDGEDSNANQIIFCDMCNIAVHQECYGVPYIPEGQWLCRRCHLSPSAPVRCALCPYTSGAFKQTPDGRWVHVICALWLNEVHFANTVFLEPVEGVDYSLKRRSKLTCLVCKRKRTGACLQCSTKSCTRAFHVTCAFNSGMLMVIREENGKSDDSVTTINRYVFCLHHSNNGSSKSRIENMAAWKRSMNDRLRNARRMLISSTKESPEVSVPVIPSERVKEIAMRLDLETMDDIYCYWSLKRSSRFGVALIRRLQVYHSRRPIETKSDNVVSPISGERKQPDESQRLAQFRRDLERFRLLVELIKKREKLKYQIFSAAEKIISKSVKPVQVILRDTLKKLIEKDNQNVFTKPVTDEEVPGYSFVISNPMDFSKMREKLDSGQYKKVTDFKTDFKLMTKNCAVFNRDNAFFWKYGHRIERMGLRLIKQAEEEESKIEKIRDSLLIDQLRRPNFLTGSDLMNLPDMLPTSSTVNSSLFDQTLSGRKPSQICEQNQSSRPRTRIGRKNTSQKEERNRILQRGRAETSITSKDCSDPLPVPSSLYASLDPKSGSVNGTISSCQKRQPFSSESRKRKITDYFSPSNPQQTEVSSFSPRSPLKISPAVSTNQGQSTNCLVNSDRSQQFKSLRSQKTKLSFDCTTTEGSSASDTGGATSMDEFEPPTHANNHKSNGNINTSNRKRRGLRQQEYRSQTNPSGVGRWKKVLTRKNHDINEFENPNVFVHNDVVWAPLENGVQMPARVIDLRMRIHMDNFPVEKALNERPKDSNRHTLVLFFDDMTDNWKWLPTAKLEHCIPTGSPAQARNDEATSNALRKARIFWQTMMGKG